MSKTYSMAFELGGKISRGFKGSLVNAGKSLEALGRQVRMLETAGKAGDRFQALRASATKTDTELGKAVAEVARLSGEMARASSPSQRLAADFERAQSRAERLRESLAGQRGELDRLGSQLREAGLRTSDLAKHQEHLAKVAARSKQVQQNLQSVVAAQAANKAARAEYRAQAVDALALGAALLAPLKAGVNFETAMLNVASVSRASDAELAKLSAQAKQLGATTSYSASQAADGMKYLAMAGFNTQQIMDSMPGVLNLARAGATDLGVASDIASDMLSAFQMDASRMPELGDALVAAFTRSNTSLELLGETMKYVGPIAGQAGVSLQEAAAMAGLMGSVGIKGSQAGTALRAALLRLSAPPKAAYEAMQKIGVEALDASGNVRPIVKILEDVAAATESMGSGERLGIFKHIFGEEASAGMAELVTKAGAGKIRQFVAEIKGATGEAARVAAKQASGSQGALDAMTSAFEGVAIAASSLFLPAITASAKVVAAFAGKTVQLIEKYPAVATAVGGVVGGLVALKIAAIAGGYAFTFLKGGGLVLVKGLRLMQSVLATSRLATVSFTGVQWLLNAALAANPIGLVIAGVAAFAGTAWLVVKYWEPISGFLGKLWDSIVAGVKRFADAPIETLQAMWASVTAWFSGISLYDSGAKLLATLAEGIRAFAAQPVEAIKGALAKVREYLPFSDAKVGPLSQLTASGRAIPATLGQGIGQAGSSPVAEPLAKVLAEIPLATLQAAPANGSRAFAPEDSPLARALQPAASKAERGGSREAINLTFAPTFNFPGAMDKAGTKAAADAALVDSERRLLDKLERIMRERGRLAYA